MAAAINKTLIPGLNNVNLKCRILLVGCGGIGGEVLKNLVLMGFSKLDIIDYDTIATSHLNRQFLFQRESVGKAKSLVARETVLKINPNVDITAIVGDITKEQFGRKFFGKFDLVVCTLENDIARKRVNSFCLWHLIPLIICDAGGYLGQIETVIKGKSKCYSCLPINLKQRYLTTDSETPSVNLNHCVAWAKLLFTRLFGVRQSKYLNLIQSSPTKMFSDKVTNIYEWALQNHFDQEKLLEKIFCDEVRCLSHEPTDFCGKVYPIPIDNSIITKQTAYESVPDTDYLDFPQNIKMFLDSVVSLKNRLENGKYNPLFFDIDEDDHMNFVVSSTNIRATMFALPMSSHFEIKSKAGNIVPAIATTNSIIGGQVVIHALRLLKRQDDKCQSVFLRGIPNYCGAIFDKFQNTVRPNLKCLICSVAKKVVLVTDLNEMTVRQFKDLVLKQKLKVEAPNVIVDHKIMILNNGKNEWNLYGLTFAELNIGDGSKFQVGDVQKSFKIKIKLYQKERLNSTDPLFEIYDNINDFKGSSSVNRNHHHDKMNKTIDLSRDEIDTADPEPTMMEQDGQLLTQESDVDDEDNTLTREKNYEDAGETTKAKKINGNTITILLNQSEPIKMVRGEPILTQKSDVDDEDNTLTREKNAEDAGETTKTKKTNGNAITIVLNQSEPIKTERGEPILTQKSGVDNEHNTLTRKRNAVDAGEATEAKKINGGATIKDN